MNLHVGKLSDLDKHVISSMSCLSSSGSNHISTFGHLFLDFRWTIYAAVFLLSQGMENQDEIPDISATFCKFSGLVKDQNYVLEMHSETSAAQRALLQLANELALQNLFELVTLALQRFDAIKVDINSKQVMKLQPIYKRILLIGFLHFQFVHQSPFGCCCIREFWLMLCKLQTKSCPNQFWYLLNFLTSSEQQPGQPVNDSQITDENILHFEIKTVPGPLYWWLIQVR